MARLFWNDHQNDLADNICVGGPQPPKLAHSIERVDAALTSDVLTMRRSARLRRIAFSIVIVACGAAPGYLATPLVMPLLVPSAPADGVTVRAVRAPQPSAEPVVTSERAVLYEEGTGGHPPSQFVGTVIWRTEMSHGPAQRGEVSIRADIDIPDRHLKAVWTLRRNTDRSLPASHTVDIMFSMPAEFTPGGIASVPGLLAKRSADARGELLAGQSVQVTSSFFLIGLSSEDRDLRRNLQSIKESARFDLPIVYANGHRAILAFDKGSTGERVFSDGLAAWGQ